jgi:hypothetical protein
VAIAVGVVAGTVVYVSRKKKRKEGQKNVEAQVAAPIPAAPLPPPAPQAAFSQPGPQPYSLYPFPEAMANQPQPAIAFRPVPVRSGPQAPEPGPADLAQMTEPTPMEAQYMAEERPPAFEAAAAAEPEPQPAPAEEEAPVPSTPATESWEALNGAVQAIEVAKAAGKDTKRAEGMLRLARTFYAKDDFKKALDYANRARNMI